jgi:cytoskeletal protein CcmA (bactofilin family)
VKIKEVFVGKNKKILQHLNIHNVFKISITLKKDDVDLSKLHSHSQRIKFSEIKMRLN